MELAGARTGQIASNKSRTGCTRTCLGWNLSDEEKTDEAQGCCGQGRGNEWLINNSGVNSDCLLSRGGGRLRSHSGEFPSIGQN